MNKYKYLATNTLIFFISNFTSKILVFLLLPLYTTVLSTSDYAISDLMTTSVNLFYMVLTLMISEGVLRFSFEEQYNKSHIFSTGLCFIIVSGMMFGCGIIFLARMNYIEIFNGHWVQFLLLYIFYSLQQLLADFMRGLQQIKLIGITGVIGTIVTVVLNIILLVVFKYGIDGYIASMILANAAACLIYFVVGKAYKYIDIGNLDKTLTLKMVKYSWPIVLTQVCWWFDTAVDRYLVTFLMGTSETGLLSAAHRLPTILTIFTSIFMQAWKLSAINEYESESSRGFFSKMLNLYNTLLMIAGAVVIILTKTISGMILKGDFFNAWYLVPPFILAFVMNGISAFLGTFYIASKNTKPLMHSAFVGAIVNVVLGFVLIKEIGTIGAGIANAVSYFIISVIRTIQVKKEMRLYLEFKRIIPSYILLIILTAIILSEAQNASIISFVILITLVWLNRYYLEKILELGLSFKKNKRRD